MIRSSNYQDLIDDAPWLTDVLAMDGRKGTRACCCVEIRSETFLVLVLDAMDAPEVHVTGRLADDVMGINAAYQAGLAHGHEDVLIFDAALRDAQWAHESILKTLSEMRSVIE